VAHLDIKPQNVLIHPPSGRLKLIDYGSAGLFDAVAAVSASSDPGAGLIAQPTSADGGSALRPEFVAGFVTEHGGTQSYLSPERVLDEEDYWSPEAFKAFLDAGAEGINGPAADVYSLGCLVFFLLRGDVPYDWEVARHRSSSMALDRFRAQQEDPANDPWRGVADPMEALTARVRANDPFGKDEGEDDEDDEDVEDERPPPSAAAVEFVRWATR